MSTQTRKRTRQSALKRWKTFNEKEILECYFELDSQWSRKTINYVKKIVKLSEEQIYKWGYERKRKLKLDQDTQEGEDYTQVNRTEAKAIKDLAQDYNSLVDELFPTCDLMADELTSEEKKKYDELKAKVKRKSNSYEELDDLDKLLCERLPLSDAIPTCDKTKTKIKRTKCRKGSMPEPEIEDELIYKPAEEIIRDSSTTQSPVKNKRDLKAQSKQDELSNFEFSFENTDAVYYEFLNQDFPIYQVPNNYQEVRNPLRGLFDEEEPLSFFSN